MKGKEPVEFEASPRSEWKLISQGAEARVWKLRTTSSLPGCSNNDTFAVCKERFSKSYRHPDLDSRLTKSRCRSEAKILEKCATKTKIRVPKVIRVSPPSLYLEYLEGPSIKSHLQQQQQQQQQNNDSSDKNTHDDDIAGITENTEVGPASTATKRSESIQRSDIPEKELAHRMGELVGRLHNIGIVHGDLTTSNMMIVNNFNNEENTSGSCELALIDFGLSKSTSSAEEQAVDLYVLERALLSTHPNLKENFFDLVLEKYKDTTEMESTDTGNTSTQNKNKRKSNNQSTLQRLEQVRMRGRKRECFG